MAARVSAKTLGGYLERLNVAHPLPAGLEYQLNNAPHYGGWRLQICHLNEGHYISTVNEERFSAREMRAFLWGAIYPFLSPKEGA